MIKAGRYKLATQKHKFRAIYRIKKRLFKFVQTVIMSLKTYHIDFQTQVQAIESYQGGISVDNWQI